MKKFDIRPLGSTDY